MNKILDIFLPYQKKFFLDNHTRKIWVSSRQLGKSFTIAGILTFSALKKNGNLSLCISTGARAASTIIEKCKQFAEAVKKLSNGRIDYTSSYDSIKFSNGSKIMSLPSSTDGANLRGFTAACVCIDEAAYVWHLDQIMQAINPTLSRDKTAQLVLTTTPAGRNGHFYDIWTKAQTDSTWYTQTTTIHEAISDGLDVDIESLRSLCPDPDQFAQEYECMFSKEHGSLIDLDLIDWYDYDISNEKMPSWVGIDVGVKSDRSSCVIGRQKDGILHIDDIVILDRMSFQEQFEVIRSLNQKYCFNGGYVDATGIGYGLSERVSKEINSKIQGLNFTGTNKTPMYEQLRTDIFQHKVKINAKFRKIVESDFKNVSRIINESGQIKYMAGHDENGHADVASGIVLLLESTRKNPISYSLPEAFTMPSLF